MDVTHKRKLPSRTPPPPGSVWESRMKSDEGRGGTSKVFNCDDNSDELPPNAATGTASGFMRSTVAVNAKRRTSKSESGLKNCDEQCKELSVSSDGIKKSPIPARKSRTTEGAPTIQARKVRSDVQKDAGESNEGADERILRKSKSDSVRTSNHNNAKSVGENSSNNSVRLRKTKSASDPVSDESSNGINGGIENATAQNEKDDGTDENCKDFEVCEEKLISSSAENVSVPKCSLELSVLVDGDADGLVDQEAEDEDDDEEEDAVHETTETEREESFDVKEINIPTEPKIVNESENNNKVVIEQEKKMVAKKPENNNNKVANELDKKVVVKEPEKKVIEQEKKMVAKKPENNNNKVANELDKKVVVKEPEKKTVVDEPVNRKALNVNQPEPKRIQSTYRRFQQNNQRPVSIPAVTVKQSPPFRRHSTIYQNFSKDNSNSEHQSFPQTQSKLQSLVDLIMWREISRSAFVFGIGTFIITSSSYAQDINVSFISVMSYLGLVYLAVIFLYRSLICRGIVDVHDKNYVLGEEEATWVLKLILPYLNELFSKLRALFSGDPGTTMKLAVLLFVLARCGNSITIWKMAKFGFFGIFTVPKVCSSYSAQLTAYGNFWVRRFRDAWDSCSHKKAVALGIFSLVWNMSSVVARVWAVFVLFVAFKYYQQHYMVRDEYVEEEEEGEEAEGDEGDTWQAVGGGKDQGLPHIKLKKGF